MNSVKCSLRMENRRCVQSINTICSQFFNVSYALLLPYSVKEDWRYTTYLP